MNRRHFLAGSSAAALLARTGKSYATAGVITRKGGLDVITTVSAAVYDATGALVRTIYSGERLVNFALSSSIWDGTIDDGSVATTGTYTIKSISHNVAYSWQGALGNTSAAFSGPGKYHALDVMMGMTIHNNKAYYCLGYNEANSGQGWFSTAAIGTANYIPTNTQGYSNGAQTCVTTDGVNVYWGSYDAFTPTSAFITATKISDNSNVSFSGSGTSVSYTVGQFNPVSTCGTQTVAAPNTIVPYSLAVQTAGNLLYATFVSSPSTSGFTHANYTPTANLVVVHKTTGAAMAASPINAYTSPRCVCMTTDDYLWLAYTSGGNPVVSKFSCNAGTGALTIVPNSTISGLSNPLAMAVSPDNSTLLIADGGSSQQIKAFVNSNVYAAPPAAQTTWASSGVFGSSGGYASTTTVPDIAAGATPRFAFATQTWLGMPTTFLAFDSDGSFWVGNPGCYRAEHYSSGAPAYGATPSYVEQIAFVPANYSVFPVAGGDGTRILVNLLEYTVNYSITAAPGQPNGAWKLTKNYGWNFASNYVDPPFWPTIMSNARTYAFIRDFGAGNVAVVELTASGIRATGVTFTQDYALRADGSVSYRPPKSYGQNAQYYSLTFNSFDGSGNPSWNSASLVVTAAVPISHSQVYPLGNDGGFYSQWDVTTNNVIPLYNGDFTLDPSAPHMGAYDATTGALKWQALPVVNSNFTLAQQRLGYYAVWPSNGWMPWSGANAFNTILSADNYLFASYRGESFQGPGQMNRIYHYMDNGLYVGMFGGTWYPRSPIPESYPGNAGNIYSGQPVKNGGNYYIYYGDESQSGGFHRFKVENLSSIVSDQVSVSWNAASYSPPASDPSDLMASLPYNAALSNGGGWTRLGPANGGNVGTDFVFVGTNCSVCDPRKSPDLVLFFAGTALAGSTASVRRTLPNVGSSWRFSANIRAADYNRQTEYVYIDILDNIGRVLAHCTWGWPSGTSSVFYINDQAVHDFGTANDMINWITDEAPLLFVQTSKTTPGTLDVGIGPYSLSGIAKYDASAAIASPSSMVIGVTLTTAVYFHSINVIAARHDAY